MWLSVAGLQTKGSPAQFPVRAYAWVAGWVPGRGCMRGNHTLMLLSLLKKKKYKVKDLDLLTFVRIWATRQVTEPLNFISFKYTCFSRLLRRQ